MILHDTINFPNGTAVTIITTGNKKKYVVRETILYDRKRDLPDYIKKLLKEYEKDNE